MFRPLATSAIALILAAGPALAEVTPAQVWENLRQSYEDMGYQVQVGSEDAAGDSLTLTGVTLSDTAETEADFRFEMPALVLTQTGADVRTVIEGPMTLQMRNTPPEGEEVGFSVTLEAPGNETLSSGSPEQMTHAFQMPTVTLTGQALDDENDTPVTMSVTEIAGSQTIARAADGSSRQTFDATAAAMQMQFSATGPALAVPETEPVPENETEGAGQPGATDSFSGTLEIADLTVTLTVTGTTAMPAGEGTFSADPGAALAAGFAADGTFGMGALSATVQSAITVEDGSTNNTSGTLGAAGADLTVGLSNEGLNYSGSLTDMTTLLSSGQMPFPLAYAAARNAFSLTLPVAASDQEQPFALSYVLDGLTLDDALWQAFDPEGTLPREPANLTIDIEGQTLLNQNLLDTETAAPETTLFQPRSLTIRDVSLDAIGASADLTGGLTFGDDPSQPVGTIAGTFSGINALLDNLVAMGVVPQDQLMAPRMMLAMFARPVEGNPDQLQTELEFREGGSVFANGQQIR